MNSLYQYTAKNLLKGRPYHYSFSAIEGDDFLLNYRAERIFYLDKISQFLSANLICKNDGGLIKALIATFHGDQVKKYKIIKMPSRENGVRTLDLLKSSSGLILTNRGSDQLGLLENIIELTRKFEVAKRLRKSYDKNWKMTTKNSAPLAAYALLAFLVAYKLGDPRDTRPLNILLKLNDLVISAIQCNTNLLVYAAVAVAIKKEIDMIDDLRKKQVG